MNIKLNIEFDGTNYSGWQRQPNALTIQEVIESKLSKLYDCPIKIMGCARTDAGVHAKEFFINFKIPSSPNIPVSKIPDALNTLLPQDIRAKKATKTDDKFHAIFNVKKKTYQYTILNQKTASVFERNFYYRFIEKLDVKKMQKAGEYLIGKHDFTAFCSEPETKYTCIRTIFDLQIKKRKNYITINLTANGFLYNMVRIIVGTLIEVGRDKIKPTDIKKILLSKNRNLAGPTVPAKGLCLLKVYYK